MGFYRNKVVDIVKSWNGCVKGDKTHMEILAIYNGHTPLARGWKMTKEQPWCATTVSAAFIKAGYADICPVECGCGEMIKKAIKMNIWIESDNYIAKPGDIIMYDWDDSALNYAKTDNEGWPEHTGIVIGCNGKTFTVQEGNFRNGCNVRTLEVNGRYIRGFIVPKYTADAEPVATVPASKPVELLPAKSYDKKTAGTYIYTGEGRKLRRGPGGGYKALVTIPKNTKLINYGYYTMVDGRKWLLVECKINGVKYTGHVSMGSKGKYVKKI